jgi:hypothetical protein
VHRDVAADVVEDVGLGQVLQLRAVADRDRRRELAPPQAVEEDVGRDVAADRACPEAGEGLQEAVISSSRGMRAADSWSLSRPSRKRSFAYRAQRSCIRPISLPQVAWLSAE